MSKKRRTFSSKQKSQIAIAAIRERETSAEIAKRYSVHPNQVSLWKKAAMEGLESIFEDKRVSQDGDKNTDQLIEELYSQIGQLQMELKWLKKKVV